MSFLELKEVEVHYNGIRALRGISLEVRKREIVALIGANGAGKTTALMAISGIVSSSSGEVWFQGQRIDGLRGEQIARLGIGQVPEGRGIFARMTVEENLRVGAYAVRDHSIIRARRERVYGMFPILAERRNQIGGTLSGGEQQMLAIGRILMMEPALLLLDEPSLGLAPKIVRQLFVTIQEINRQGVTILIVEQNARKALEIASRGYVLEVGRINKVGQAADLIADPDVRRAYLGGGEDTKKKHV